MRKILFVLASTGSLATMNAAIAQYPATGYYATGYYVPGYYGRRYYAPGYIAQYYAPGYYAPGDIAPGYYGPGASAGATVGTNNAGNTGFVGECAIGPSEETCRRRGQKYNPPRQN
jgi:hypothetical protein